MARITRTTSNKPTHPSPVKVSPVKNLSPVKTTQPKISPIVRSIVHVRPGEQIEPR